MSLKVLVNIKILITLDVGFIKGSLYLDENIKIAFVSTNSISQGTQVNDLWPHILKNGVEIFFAVKDFIWTNNAKNNAAVICSIIGLEKTLNKSMKYIYYKEYKKNVLKINAYLLNASDIYIEKRTTPLSEFPLMNQGNIPFENGLLRFNLEEEKLEIISLYPNSEIYLKKLQVLKNH